MIHVDGCECVACQIARASGGRASEAERYWAMVHAASKDQAREYRRGKPVVSKGCKGCHQKRK